MDAAHCEDDRERGQRHCRACGGHRELRSEEHTSELQSRLHLVCRLLLEKKKHHVASFYNLSHDLICRAHQACDFTLGTPVSLTEVVVQRKSSVYRLNSVPSKQLIYQCPL